MGRIWDDVLLDRDRQVYAAAGYGERVGLGKRPAVLVVDVTYNFVGVKPEPILDSISKFPFSCGEVAWEAVRNIKELLPVARELNVPIVYSTEEYPPQALHLMNSTRKNRRSPSDCLDGGLRGSQIVEAIAPGEKDLVIKKQKPSVFWGTPFMSYLNQMGVDSLLVCGGTTSGCVRATVVDAFSYNFLVSVVEECTFDRGLVSHKVNLFDMDQKYADVISLKQAMKYLRSLSG